MGAGGLTGRGAMACRTAPLPWIKMVVWGWAWTGAGTERRKVGGTKEPSFMIPLQNNMQVKVFGL